MCKSRKYLWKILDTEIYCNIFLSTFVDSNDDMQMRNWQAANWLCTLQLLKVITLPYVEPLSNTIYYFLQLLVINYVQIHRAISPGMTSCLEKPQRKMVFQVPWYWSWIFINFIVLRSFYASFNFNSAKIQLYSWFEFELFV